MAALTVEQVKGLRRVFHEICALEGEHKDVDALCDLALTALSERGEPAGWLLWPSMRFKPNAGIGVYPPVSVKVDPIPLYTRPQAGQEDDRDYKALYLELLYQVGNKHPGETRHQTALRYLQRAEQSGNTAGAKAAQGGSHG